MAVQTYATLTALQRNAYNKILFSRAFPRLIGFKDAEKGSIPKNSGLTMEFRHWPNLAVATTALTEGVPPTDTALAVEKITFTVLQYGAWVRASDLLVHQGIDPVWAQIYALLGEQAGRTLHTLLFATLATGGVVQLANGRAARINVVAGDNLTMVEVRKAVRTLSKNNIDRFPDGFYHAFIHPSSLYDLMSDTAWRNPMEYRGDFNGNSIATGEVGSIYGVKFFSTSDAPIFAGTGGGAIDLYGTIVYGPGFYGIHDLEAQPTPTINSQTAMGMRITGVPVDTETKDDALGQFGVAGWKATFVAALLKTSNSPQRAVRIEHAVSA